METIARPIPTDLHRKKRLALNTILSDLQHSEDGLSGSECSSLATSPVEKPWHSALSPLSKEISQEDLDERQRGRSPHRFAPDEVPLEPVEVVKRLFEHLDDADVIEELVAEDAGIQWLSHMGSAHEVVRCALDSIMRE